jgi:hypothetical protein
MQRLRKEEIVKLLFITACALVASPALAELGIPVGPITTSIQEVGTGLVEITWNEGTSLPTPIRIRPASIGQRPVIVSPALTEEEAEARVKEFIDSNPQLFKVTSADFPQISAHAYLNNTSWLINAVQYCDNIPVIDGYVHFWITNEGELVSGEFRVFPSSDLVGFDVNPSITEEQGLAAALSSEPGLFSTGTQYWPSLAIVFVAEVPTLARIVEVGDSNRHWRWLFTVSAETAQILSIDSALDEEGNLGISFVRGDIDNDGKLKITDACKIIEFLFLGSPDSLLCEKAADVDSSGEIDITDAVYLLTFEFLGGSPPGYPFPLCGKYPFTTRSCQTSSCN